MRARARSSASPPHLKRAAVTLLAISCLAAGILPATDAEDKAKAKAKAKAEAEAKDKAESHYREGIKALDGVDLRNALRELESAIKYDPQESPRPVKIYGTFYLPYLPHYYQGVVLCRQGKCAEAQGPFEESKRQNALKDKESKYYERVFRHSFKGYEPDEHLADCTKRQEEGQ